VRPPWSDEASVLERCTRCGDCVSACPEDILTLGSGGFPEVDFHAGSGECSFCGACAQSCDAGVFDLSRRPAWQVLASVAGKRCLAESGIHCEACRDACGERAIRFRPRLGAPPAPDLDPAACTGCGACVAVCPGQAITVLPHG